MTFHDINGVRAYSDVTGDGEPVVFLHGGFCSAEVMRPLAEQLTGYAVHSPERPGHGRTPDRPGPITYGAFIDDTLAYLDAVGLESAHIVGFSDGAILGYLLLRDHPERVRSLVAISGNIHTDEVWVAEELHAASVPQHHHELLDQEYGALSPDGAAHSAQLLERIVHMWTVEPQIAPESFVGVSVPVMVMAGDRDMIKLEHTVLIAESIPGAQLAIVPDAGHMLIRDKPELIGMMLQQFLDNARS